MGFHPTVMLLIGGVILTIGDLAIKTWIIKEN